MHRVIHFTEKPINTAEVKNMQYVGQVSILGCPFCQNKSYVMPGDFVAHLYREFMNCIYQGHEPIEAAKMVAHSDLVSPQWRKYFRDQGITNKVYLDTLREVAEGDIPLWWHGNKDKEPPHLSILLEYIENEKGKIRQDSESGSVSRMDT